MNSVSIVLRSLWRILTTPYNHKAALQFILDTGKEIGRNTAPIVYVSDHCCPRHPGEPLVETSYGDFKCPRCYLFAAGRQQLTLIHEPVTDEIQRIEQSQARYGVYVHRALEEGVPLQQAITEYQATRKVGRVRLEKAE